MYFFTKLLKMSDDHQMLQTDLNLITKWSADWLMDFNIFKYKVLQIKTCHNKSTFTYKIVGHPTGYST